MLLQHDPKGSRGMGGFLMPSTAGGGAGRGGREQMLDGAGGAQL